jgi:hypothetical protein
MMTSPMPIIMLPSHVEVNTAGQKAGQAGMGRQAGRPGRQAGKS